MQPGQGGQVGQGQRTYAYGNYQAPEAYQEGNLGVSSFVPFDGVIEPIISGAGLGMGSIGLGGSG